MRRRAWRRRRRGFTLPELLVALVVNRIILVAGVLMLRTIVRATGATLDRTLAGGEVQDIRSVLEPMVQDVGMGLPVDRGFVPIGVQSTTSTRTLHLFFRDTTAAIQTGYRCVPFRNTPTFGCMTLAAAPMVGQHLLLVSSLTGAARLIQVTTVTGGAGGFAVAWDTTASVLGFPRAGHAVAGESGTQVLPLLRTRVAWDLRRRRITVAEGLRTNTVVGDWVLGERVNQFTPTMLYLGVTPGGMPTMSGTSFANNITAIRLALAQDFTVRGVPRVNTRTLTVTPVVLVQ